MVRIVRDFDDVLSVVTGTDVVLAGGITTDDKSVAIEFDNTLLRLGGALMKPAGLCIPSKTLPSVAVVPEGRNERASIMLAGRRMTWRNDGRKDVSVFQERKDLTPNRNYASNSSDGPGGRDG